VKIPRVPAATLVPALLAALAFAGPALRPISDSDIWWHLKAGSDILAGRPGAFTESWSFTAAGRPWINHEWLAEWRFALARSAGGERAVVGFAAAVLFFTALLLFRAARLEGVPPPFILLGLAFVPLVAGSRFVPRPQIFTYLLLSLFLERLATARRKAGARAAEEAADQVQDLRRPSLLFLSLFPLAQVVWTNMHGPVIGLGVGTVLILGGALPSLSLRGRFGLIASLALASLVHPQGYRALVEYVPQLVGGGLYNQTIREWLPLTQLSPSRMSETAATWVLIAASAALGITGFLRPESRKAWAWPLLLILLAAAPVSSVRHRDLLAIFFVPAAAVVVTTLRRRRPWLPGRAARWGALAAAVGLMIVTSAGLLGYPAAWPPDPRLDTSEFPVAAADFVAQERIGERIFNAYDYGGYLVDRLAPEHRVFIDGRYFVYGESVYRDYLEVRDGGPNARGVLDRTGADLLLVRYPEGDGYQGLALRARDWPDWSLVFWDDATLIYARNSQTRAGWLAQHVYRAMDPTLPPALDNVEYWKIHFQEIVAEAARAHREAPRAVRPLLVRALACEYNGLLPDAAEAYDAILTLDPANRPAREGLSRIHSRTPSESPGVPGGPVQ
jgi:hypothetical protein